MTYSELESLEESIAHVAHAIATQGRTRRFSELMRDLDDQGMTEDEQILYLQAWFKTRQREALAIQKRIKHLEQVIADRGAL